MKSIKYLNDNTIYVEVSYDVGGINHFSGEEQKRGYRLHIQPCQVRDGIVSFSPMAGRFVFLCEVGRRSDKKQSELWLKIEPHAQAVVDLFLQGQYGMIPPFIKEKVLS